MNVSRILIVGARGKLDGSQFFNSCNRQLNEWGNSKVLLLLRNDHGPVTVMAKWLSAQKGIPCHLFDIDWNRLGPSAIYQCNDHLLRCATHVLIYTDGFSEDLKYLESKALGLGLTVKVLYGEFRD